MMSCRRALSLVPVASQTARFLLKGLLAVKTGKARQQPLTGSMAYLNNLPQELGSSCSAKGVDCWANPTMALAALRQRAARLLVRGAEVLQVRRCRPLLMLAHIYRKCPIDV